MNDFQERNAFFEEFRREGPRQEQFESAGPSEYGWRRRNAERSERFENTNRPSQTANFPPFLNDWVAYCPANFEEFFRRISQRFQGFNGQQTTQQGPQSRPENVPWPRFDPANFDRFTASMVTDVLFYVSQLIINFGTQIAQFIFYKISGFLYRSALYITFFILKYTILAPILAPYYTIRAYWRRAELIWRTSQSIWAFLCRTWLWWTGGQKVRNEMNEEIRFETGASMDEQPNEFGDLRGRQMPENKQNPQEFNYWEFAIWLLFYLPIVLSICWLFYHYYWPAWFIEKFLKIFGF